MHTIDDKSIERNSQRLTKLVKHINHETGTSLYEIQVYSDIEQKYFAAFTSAKLSEIESFAAKYGFIVPVIENCHHRL